MRVTAIVRRPLDLGEEGSGGSLLVLTPAFAKTYDGRVGEFGDRNAAAADILPNPVGIDAQSRDECREQVKDAPAAFEGVEQNDLQEAGFSEEEAQALLARIVR